MFPPVVIAAVVLVAAVYAGLFGGLRLGRRQAAGATESFRNHVSSVSGSLLGLLGLLLGFAFSQSLQRFEARSEALVREATAIRKVEMAAKIVGSDFHSLMTPLLLEYTRLRLEESVIALTDGERRDLHLARTNEVQRRLLGDAAQLAQARGFTNETIAFADAVESLVEAQKLREAALVRHVPLAVMGVLIAVLVTTAIVHGYSIGVGLERFPFVTHLLIVFIVLAVMLIFDLDQPRRGVVRVNTAALVDVERDLRTNSNESLSKK